MKVKFNQALILVMTLLGFGFVITLVVRPSVEAMEVHFKHLISMCICFNPNWKKLHKVGKSWGFSQLQTWSCFKFCSEQKKVLSRFGRKNKG